MHLQNFKEEIQERHKAYIEVMAKEFVDSAKQQVLLEREKGKSKYLLV